MNRCRTLVAGALIAVPLATIGISAEAAFAADPCGAITDDPACREGGMDLKLEDEDTDPSPGFPTGCPVVPYQGQNFSANCSFAPYLSSQSQPLEPPVSAPTVESSDAGLSATAVAGAGAAALLLALGVPMWIRRTRRDS